MDWHVLIRTRGGQVSLLKGLTEEAAKETVRRLTPPWLRPDIPYEARARSWPRYDGDVIDIEAFGPGGVDLVVWPSPPDSPPP